MINNRGQSLVLFILVIPIVFLVIMGIVDIGKISMLREELDGINYVVTEYGLDKIDDVDLNDKLEEIIRKNKSDIDKIDIVIEDKKLKITLEDNVNLVLIKNSNVISIKSSYIGYFEDEKKIIERNK